MNQNSNSMCQALKSLLGNSGFLMVLLPESIFISPRDTHFRVSSESEESFISIYPVSAAHPSLVIHLLTFKFLLALLNFVLGTFRQIRLLTLLNFQGKWIESMCPVSYNTERALHFIYFSLLDISDFINETQKIAVLGWTFMT